VTTTDYQPVSCDLHSKYELLAMRRDWVSLDGEGPAGSLRGLHCQVLDVVTRAGAEYLVVQDRAGQRLEIRLDQLVAVSPTG
jgi:transcriptional antiterminator Rof (Rho-off)